MNPGILVENDIKRECVKEVIDEYLALDEIVYDGNFISLYEMDKILREKMDYLKDLCNPMNYISDNKVIDVKFKKNSEYRYKYISDTRYNLLYDKYFCVDITINLYENLYIRMIFDKVYDELKCKILSYRDYDVLMLPDNFYETNEGEKIGSKFMEDNNEILLELLTILDNFKEILDIKNKQCLVSRENVINLQFDIGSMGSKVSLDILGNNIENLKELGLDGYFLSKRNDLFKKIGINIEELNSFYKNEVEEFYNSINNIDYKSYIRKK